MPQTGPSAPGYLSWLDSHGFSMNQNDYPIVDVTDDGIGNGTVNSGDYHYIDSAVFLIRPLGICGQLYVCCRW